MPDIEAECSIREAVGYFKTTEALEQAVDELLSSGFNRAELSLLADEHTVEKKLGHRYKTVTELEDDPNVSRTHLVSDESIGDAQGALIGIPLYVAALAGATAMTASGGSLAAMIAAGIAAGGAGGLVGSIFAKKVGKDHAHYLQEQLEHGGLLLWVRTLNADDEARAITILNRHSGQDVHLHGVAHDS